MVFLRTGRMSLKDETCGDGEGVSSPLECLSAGGMALGSDLPLRLLGPKKALTSFGEPSFSHLCPSSCTVRKLHQKLEP